MDDILINNARARYGFDRLSAEAVGRTAPPVGPFALATDKLGALEFVRRVPDTTGGSRYTDDYVTAGGAHVLVTISRAPDSEAAHESLLRFLANSMADQLPRARERGVDVGDTAFANLAEPPTSVAFVRRNVFVKVAYADARDTGEDVRNIAAAIDRQIVNAPALP